MNATTYDNADDLADDLRITKTTRRASGGGKKGSGLFFDTRAACVRNVDCILDPATGKET